MECAICGREGGPLSSDCSVGRCPAPPTAAEVSVTFTTEPIIPTEDELRASGHLPAKGLGLLPHEYAPPAHGGYPTPARWEGSE